MADHEKKLENDLRLAVSKKRHRLFRCNSGMAWAGRILSKTKKTLTLINPRPFRGHPEGTPDLAGWAEIEITPEMVGRRLAVFCAIELKTGRVPLTKKQRQALDAISKAGGISGVVKTADEFWEILSEYEKRITRSNYE